MFNLQCSWFRTRNMHTHTHTRTMRIDWVKLYSMIFVNTRRFDFVFIFRKLSNPKTRWSQNITEKCMRVCVWHLQFGWCSMFAHSEMPMQQNIHSHRAASTPDSFGCMRCRQWQTAHSVRLLSVQSSRSTQHMSTNAVAGKYALVSGVGRPGLDVERGV